ncbi:MAG: hypothetical protein FWG80_00455 [Alphaproteobacteria bacterium]|nr:hypothetical protein [Alphaproteobacteria bacterium]
MKEIFYKIGIVGTLIILGAMIYNTNGCICPCCYDYENSFEYINLVEEKSSTNASEEDYDYIPRKDCIWLSDDDVAAIAENYRQTKNPNRFVSDYEAAEELGVIPCY